jgi:hypothetical protein
MISKRALVLVSTLTIAFVATIPMYLPTSMARTRYPGTPTVLDAVTPVDPTDPLDSLWQEVSPEAGNIYKLLSWEDDTEVIGVLDPSDQIDMKLWFEANNWAQGWKEYYHVDDVVLDAGNIVQLVLSPKIHWKISLAQKNADAWIMGFLTDDLGDPIAGTDFFLNCSEREPVWYRDPINEYAEVGFVHTKVFTIGVPYDIFGELWIDWGQGFTEPIFIDFDFIELPYHLQIEGPGYPMQEVVVEVSEEPEPLEFQIQLKTPSVPSPQEDPTKVTPPVSPLVVIGGLLTQNTIPIEGTEFQIQNWIEFGDPAWGEGWPTLMPTGMQCKVFQDLPFCTVPNDIHLEVYIDWDAPPDGEFDDVVSFDAAMPYFPWKWTYTITEQTSIYYGMTIEVEVEEVQKHMFLTMGGFTKSYGQLATAAAWPMEFEESTMVEDPANPGVWLPNLPVPFATRSPLFTPGAVRNYVVATQPNPITGIVKLSVPTEGAYQLDHTYYSPRFETYFRVMLFMVEQGCGYLFTESGKNPVSGDVDYAVINNDLGVFTMGQQFISAPAIPIPPCMGNRPWLPLIDSSLPEQWVSGGDEIPGTGDTYDAFGDGTPDPAGSALLYMPTLMVTLFFDGTKFTPLFSSPWPQVMTTATASDVVVEPNSALDGLSWAGAGNPTQFLASGSVWNSVQKDYYAMAISDWASAWSCLNVPTVLGHLDVMYAISAHNVRDDPAFLRWGDANQNGMVDGLDYGAFGATWSKMDENFGLPNATDYHWYAGPDGLWNTVDDDRQIGTFNANFDFNNNGMIDGLDYGTFGANWPLPIVTPPP